MITQPVVAAVDGSDDSLRALEWALDTARRREAPLRVAHVRQYALWGRPGAAPAGLPTTEDDPVLGLVRDRLAGRTGLPPVDFAALDGAPGVVLPELGSTAQLLVLGSRGRGGFTSLLLGSNSLAAARDAECPVVVVPRPGRDTGAPAGDPGAWTGIVVGVNVDGPDEATLAFAFREAALHGTGLRVLAAYPWPPQTWMLPGEMPAPQIDQSAVEHETRVLADGFLTPHRARHPEVTAEVRVLPGDAAGHLVAASGDAGLVVVGRHRRRLLAPARMMGSVTQAVLLHAASPVAVVPPAPPEE
ncbi:universal stress protein [Streptomyces prasinopilosus]|uniref:Nucleotide-binding universal stress protein, UspA family n=1 Tax=Streptomyces prasinopilosus TaxID=67344 RepID=A0A1G6SII5_9ACTN|nr:universal stress protein [Streptomyces prasinopilosus]SDD16712.1 Nucleotide-binding universal stress protein, UspA family [Streptomyces prasinopilosus]